MFTLIIENAATIIVTLILAAVVAAALIKIIKNKKSGRSSCGCSCSGCVMKDRCHSDSKEKINNSK